jgi:hypothetical protein
MPHHRPAISTEVRNLMRIHKVFISLKDHLKLRAFKQSFKKELKTSKTITFSKKVCGIIKSLFKIT